MAIKAESEAEIQKACLQYLRLIGAYAIRINGGAAKVGKRFVRFTDTPGCPDVLVCMPPSGRLIGIEVKRPGGRLRPNQGVQLDAIRAAGGVAFVVRSLADLRAALAAEGFEVP